MVVRLLLSMMVIITISQPLNAWARGNLSGLLATRHNLEVQLNQTSDLLLLIIQKNAGAAVQPDAERVMRDLQKQIAEIAEKLRALDQKLESARR
ncbi:MAG: hypothetical protein HYR96_16340 [Deltaproteobacteria bacterium]|nr:hypothetical protein [Deltaproteobacteria bacterium]